MSEGALGPVQAQSDLFSRARTAERYSSLPVFAPVQRQQGEKSAHNCSGQTRRIVFANVRHICITILFAYPNVVVKSMGDEQFCERCSQRHDCRGIYGKLGNAEGPSLTLRVVLAFLMPILVFIVSLGVLEKGLGWVTERAALRTAASLSGAVVATLAWILTASAIDRRLGKRR